MKKDEAMKKPKKQKASEAKKPREGPISLYPLTFEEALKGLLTARGQRDKKKAET